MNKHTKLLMGILIVVLVLLVIATVSFSLDVSKSSKENHVQSADDSVSSNGNRITENEMHMYGVADSSGNMVIEAMWKHLYFIGTDYVVATQTETSGGQTGILDLEGNVIVPFVYSEIQTLTSSFYLASFADSSCGRFVLYDDSFRAENACTWDDCQAEKDQITLRKGKDSFSFVISDDTLTLKKMELIRTDENTTFSVNYDAALSIDQLFPNQWRAMADVVQQCLSLLRTQDTESVAKITDSEHEKSVLQSFAVENADSIQWDEDIYLSENEAGSFVWQIGFQKGERHYTCIMNIAEGTDGTWMITGLQIN